MCSTCQKVKVRPALNSARKQEMGVIQMFHPKPSQLDDMIHKSVCFHMMQTQSCFTMRTNGRMRWIMKDDDLLFILLTDFMLLLPLCCGTLARQVVGVLSGQCLVKVQRFLLNTTDYSMNHVYENLWRGFLLLSVNCRSWKWVRLRENMFKDFIHWFQFSTGHWTLSSEVRALPTI